MPTSRSPARSGRNALVALLCLASTLTVPGGSPAEPGRPDLSAPHRQGELLVKYRDGAGASARETSRDRHLAARVGGLPPSNLERVRLPPGVTAQEALRDYREDPDVEYAEPDYRLTAARLPNDPNFPSLWGLFAIGAPAAWEVTQGTGDVVVAVIDSGIDYAHPDLKANLWVNPQESGGAPGQDDDGDYVKDDTYGLNAIKGNGDPMDDAGHGTHVAGTIAAAGNNGLGVTGVSWKSKVLACKFLDAGEVGYVSDAIECLWYVRRLKDRGVDIVATNNSWGGSPYSQALYDAIRAQRDILFVTAAGNEGVDNDVRPTYPAAFDLPNVVTVAATDAYASLPYFSNYGGRSVHVAAPGVQILSTFLKGGYANMSGTSMATAYVTGVAALLKAADPTRDWRTIRNLLLAGGTPRPELGAVTVTGRLIDAAGSLSCADAPVFGVLRGPYGMEAGQSATFSALSINCARPAGPVTVTPEGRAAIELRDDGLPPDLEAGDGIFAGTWTAPERVGSFLFHSPSGSQAVGTAAPPTVTSAALPAGAVREAYLQTLQAGGGFPPYRWALAEGLLPSGVSLDPSSGTISGAPGAAGTYFFSVQVSDQLSSTADASFSFVVSVDATVPTASLPNAAEGPAAEAASGGGGGGGGCFVAAAKGGAATHRAWVLYLAFALAFLVRALAESRRL